MRHDGNSSKIPSVSVIVPICNVEKYLRQCLDSVVNQTLRDIEIVLINDGSTDSSLSIINEYAENDERIVVIDKPNSGYGDSMNKGIKTARGKYIGIVESDDWIELNMFETLYECAENDQLDVARSEFFRYSTNVSETNIKTYMDFVPHNIVVSPREQTSIFFLQPSIWANLYLRSFLLENDIKFLPTPGASYQDTSFSFKVYACADRMKIIDEAFYHYRIDGGSSSFQNTTKVYCVCDEYREIWSYVRKNGTYDRYRHMISRMQYNGYKWNYYRLTSPYSEEFFKRWSEEFIVLEKDGAIDHNMFNLTDSMVLDNVLSNKCIEKDRPWVSIIVPVYNMEKFLPKCLDSLINQSLKNIEIICVNDGSTDNSRKIMSEYEKKDPRIVVIDKPNGGLSSARNAGMEVARADRIGFLDSDDWVEIDAYESAFYASFDSDIVCYGTNVTGDAMMDRREDDNRYYSIRYEGKKDLTNEIRLNVDVSAWNKLYLKRIITDNDLEFPEGMLYEDYSFYWRYISLCNTAFFIKEKKHNYLRREGSIMESTFNGNERAIEHLLIYPDIASFIKTKSDIGSPELLNSTFLNCFWFAYNNVPLRMKRQVIKKAGEIARALHLSGDDIIDNLNAEKYDLVDPRIDDAIGAYIDDMLASEDGRRIYDDLVSEYGIERVGSVIYRNHRNRIEQISDKIFVKKKNARDIKKIGIFCHDIEDSEVKWPISDLLSLFVRMGYGVTVITEIMPKGIPKFVSDNDIGLLMIPEPNTETDGIYKRIGFMRYLLQSNKTDLVLYDTSTCQDIFYDMMAIKSLDIVFVATIHKTFSDNPVYAFSENSCVVKHADVIHTVSGIQKRYWENYGLNVHFIPDYQTCNSMGSMDVCNKWEDLFKSVAAFEFKEPNENAAIQDMMRSYSIKESIELKNEIAAKEMENREIMDKCQKMESRNRDLECLKEQLENSTIKAVKNVICSLIKKINR